MKNKEEKTHIQNTEKHKFSTLNFSKKSPKTIKKPKVSNTFNTTDVDNLFLYVVFHNENVENVENFFILGKMYRSYLQMICISRLCY